jgi:hypothetical protein
MKITKKILEKIIKEELENITNPDKQQINETEAVQPREAVFEQMTMDSLNRIEKMLKQLLAAGVVPDAKR